MDIAQVSNLGVAAFAIYIMWKMSDRNARQLDDRETALRGIEKEVREKVMDQLNKNTRAFESVLDHFSKQ